MVLKKIEIIGTSPEAFYKAVQNAVKEAGKTVRGMKWAEVTELGVKIEGEKIKEYKATVKIAFEVER
ncbi:MAG: dodecin family protein [Candidatus Bathyarchaeia archaeon]